MIAAHSPPRITILLALLLPAMLNACSHPDHGTAANAPGLRTLATQPAGPALELAGCANLGAVFPVPLESARAALPPGFEPIAASGDPAGGATLYVLGLRCAHSILDGVEQGAAALAYAELAVTPPEDFLLEEIGDYTVPLLFVASPPAIGEALAVYQLGQAGAGSVSWEDLTPAGGSVVRASLGDATLTLTGVLAPTPPTALGAGGFALFGVQDGAVRSLIKGYSQGGESVQGLVRLEASGGPALLQEARQAARGFSVSGFDLSFAPAGN